MNTLAEPESIGDARLVALCLAGDRDAFAHVVARYQSLVCGIAYSACGDVGRSEDLAQDTFIAAWKNLDALKEPAKLKNWLCGIARNLVHNSLRRELRTPTAQSESSLPELCSEGASPHEQAVSKEEESLVWQALEAIPVCCAKSLMKTHHLLFIRLLIGLALAYVIAIALLSIWSIRRRRKVLAAMTVEERATDPTTPAWEYRSKFQLLGLPFIHVRAGERLARPVKAWIAMGNCAFGVLFAFGGLAVAPVSCGGCAIGLLPFGGLAVGALALGGLGIGVWSFGGMAVGWQAFGGCAIAWDSALGGLAVARDFALGGLAQAMQFNNAAAEHHIKAHAFFRYSEMALPYCAWMNLLWFIPMLALWRTTARRAKR